MLIDANVWVSSLVAQDVHHVPCRRWLDERVQAGDALVAPTLVLPEVAGAIARRTGIPGLGRQAAEGMLRIPGLRLVPLDLALAEDAARLAAMHHLRGADAVYVAVASALNLSLVTLDQELLSRASAFVPVIRP